MHKGGLGISDGRCNLLLQANVHEVTSISDLYIIYFIYCSCHWEHLKIKFNDPFSSNHLGHCFLALVFTRREVKADDIVVSITKTPFMTSRWLWWRWCQWWWWGVGSIVNGLSQSWQSQRVHDK